MTGATGTRRRFTRQRVLGGTACLGALAGGLVLPPGAARAQEEPAHEGQEAQRASPAGVRQTLDFDQVALVPGQKPGSYRLIVSGTKPDSTMRVQLVPLVYIRQPEYWGITVTGLGRVLDSASGDTPYKASLALEGSMGTLGIEVIGASRSERLDIPAAAPSPQAVTATGTLQPMGFTTFQYGSHALHGPTFYALRSSRLDLNRYVGRQVLIFGFLVPGYPIEGGPPYVDVQWVQLHP
jgi:hypothetical protein